MFVKRLTARERLNTIDDFDDDATLVDHTVGMLTIGVCDKDGTAIFTADDADVIAGLDSAVIQRLTKAFQDGAGMTAEVQEQLAKNSETVPAGSSPSS